LPAVAVGAGAIDRLDTDRLGRVMTQLRMGKLLASLADESGDENLQLAAVILRAETSKPEERDALLARAATLMKERATAMKEKLPGLKESDPNAWEEALNDYYRMRLRYIETQYLNRGKPYVDRFNFLLAGESEREFLAQLTAEAPNAIRRLQRAVIRDIEDYSVDLMYVVTLLPSLESIDRQLKYKGGFVFYTAALGLPKLVPGEAAPTGARPTGELSAEEAAAEPAETSPAEAAPATVLVPNEERRRLLGLAMRSIAPYADPPNPDYEGWEPYARLLKARCHRGLGEHSVAEGLLQWCAGPESEPAIVGEALFELARNKGEWAAAMLVDNKQAGEAEAKFREALAAVESVVRRTKENRNALAADVRKLMLDAYIYDLWAESLRRVGQDKDAAEKADLSESAFVTFLEKYPDPGARTALYDLIAPKFENVEDYSKLNPMIVLVLAIGRVEEAMAAEDVEGINEARAMFETIRNSDDPAAAKAAPDALWYLGVIYNQQLDTFASVTAFRELANKYTDNPRSYLAAKNAVSLMYQLIESRIQSGETVQAAQREQLVESLELILKHWSDEPGAVQYHFDLGWQASRLAEGAVTNEEAEKWLTKAIENYKEVPEDNDLYLWAKGMGLELEARRLLETTDATTQKTQARSLYRRLTEHGEQVHKLLPSLEADSDRRGNLAASASSDEFLAERIRYEALGQKAEAIAAIEKLADRWPATAVLRESREYLIRALVERGEVAAAVERLRDFEKRYSQAEAEDLMAVVIDGLSGRIQDLVAEGGKAAELDQYRKAYLDFARKYYQQRIDEADQDERYRITLLLADALIQSGAQPNAREALELFQQLESVEESRRKAREKEIADYFTQQRQNVQRAGAVISAIELLHKDWKAAVETFDAADWEQRSSAGMMIRHAWAKLKAAKAGGEGIDTTPQEAAETLRAMISRGYDQLEPVAKRTIARNATVFLGLAHCRRLLGDYSKAAGMYRRVTRGLNPNSNPAMYAEAQLGYVQSVYQDNIENPDALKKLDTYIEQLRSMSPNFWDRGCFLPQFNRIQREIRNRTHT
ncbi:MAG: hypothetical protein KGY81_06815, partial [Phycisphaerae bacterium]|nr:hypothetical protein [Phycisphaerae bacterium]